MKRILTVLAGLVGSFLVVFGALSFHAVISGDGPFDFCVQIAAIGMVLLIANAAFNFKRYHPHAHGLIQIVIGCVILLSQMPSGGSDANDGMFAVKFLAAVYFFVDGFENWRSGRAVRNEAAR